MTPRRTLAAAAVFAAVLSASGCADGPCPRTSSPVAVESPRVAPQSWLFTSPAGVYLCTPQAAGTEYTCTLAAHPSSVAPSP